MQYRVTASRLNVRKEPSLQTDVIHVLQNGQEVEVIEATPDGYWKKVKLGSGFGWCSHKYLVSLQNESEIGDEEFPWMPIALREKGVAAVPGEEDNPRVLEYLRSTTLNQKMAAEDETPWCSAFVNWCVEKSGHEGTDSAWARSWANWGQETKKPVPGCIVVLTRGASSGHVGFYVGEANGKIQLLGGNQSRSVKVSNYDKERLISYRVPAA